MTKFYAWYIAKLEAEEIAKKEHIEVEEIY